MVRLDPQDLRIAGLTGAWGAGSVMPNALYDGRSDLHPTSRSFRLMQQKRRFALPRVVNRSGAKLVHILEAAGTPIGLRVPKVVTCHDLIPLIFHEEYLDWYEPRLVRSALDMRRYGTATRIIAVSSATKVELVERLRISESKIDVVHHGIDHELFRKESTSADVRVLSDLGLRKQSFVLCVGGGDKRKNLAHLLKAFAASGLASELELVFAGSLGSAEGRLTAEARRLGVLHRTRFLGYVTEEAVAALYRSCLVHALPSLYEGFGFPVLEAMACGAPTLAARRAGVEEIAGEAIRCIDGTDVEQTADSLKALCENTDLQRELRTRGFQVASGFTWDACGRRTVDSYRRALAEV